jgi:hypothetical protein
MLGPLRRIVFVAGSTVPLGGRNSSKTGTVIERLRNEEFDRGALRSSEGARAPRFRGMNLSLNSWIRETLVGRLTASTWQESVTSLRQASAEAAEHQPKTAGFTIG